MTLVKKDSEVDEDYDAYDEGLVHLYVTFPERADGLENGCYKYESEGNSFRAGSYSGYSYWRRFLSSTILRVTSEKLWELMAEKSFPSFGFLRSIFVATNKELDEIARSLEADPENKELIQKGKAFLTRLNGNIDVPFLELIHFSDCEGIIGPKTSAKLYKDFEKYRDKFKKESKERTRKENEDQYGDLLKTFGKERLEKFLARENQAILIYDDFMSAFETASNNGVVLFC